VLGALGVDMLFGRAGLRRWTRLILAFTAAMIVGTAIVLAMQGLPEDGPAWQSWRITRAEGPAILFALALLIGCLVWRNRLRANASAVAVGLIAVDMTLFAGQFFTIGGPGTNREIAQTLAAEGVGRVLSVCTGELSSPAMMSLG